ncbi:MAG: chromosomal replication initiator protein DnaA [Patescibacteria group bacterium]
MAIILTEEYALLAMLSHRRVRSSGCVKYAFEGNNKVKLTSWDHSFLRAETMTNEEIWQSVLAQIQLNISPANFSTWFRNTGIVEQKDNEISVSVPNSFAKEWLEQKYNKSIFKILNGLDERIRTVKYVVSKSELKVLKKTIAPVVETDQLEFQEFKINQETNLNPRYTFENFIVGPFNELAQAAGWAASKNPGQVYNPLFIYGGVGLGKTHLLQAIGNEVLKASPEKKVKYLPSEKFTSGVVASIKSQDMEGFKSKLRTIDVLIIDDIQFLAGKEKTQEEFFHTFNSLYEKNKQIILSSDRPPKAIPALAERLRSRFEGGMIADISYPDFETRVAILKVKSQEKKADFSDEILNYIASNIQKNIRELEGALNRLVAYQKLQNQTPDLEIAKSLLKNLVAPPTKIASPKQIIQTVASFYDLREKDILSISRKKEIVKPRQVAMYLLREELKSSFPFIGRRFGGKDHTTAIHSYEKIVRDLEKDNNLNDEINLIKQRIISA